MRKKTFFLAGLLVCLIGAAAWGYYLYQKPRSGVENTRADYTISAEDLYNAFARDEVKADQMYTNKVLEIEGVIQQVDTLQDGVNILLASRENSGGVNCSMATLKIKPLVGERIVVKGRCTGFLLDVNLVDAVLKEI